MGLYDVPMFMSLLGFSMGIMFSNFCVYRMMLLFNAMVYIEVCESKRSYVFHVPDVPFVEACGVVVFAVFYFLMDLSCECNIM